MNCFEEKNSSSNLDSNTVTTLGLIILINELNKNNETIKQLYNKNKELIEENATLKKKTELLNQCFNTSEEMRKYCTEDKVMELRKEIKCLEEKIYLLENKLKLQTELNVELVHKITDNE